MSSSTFSRSILGLTGSLDSTQQLATEAKASLASDLADEAVMRRVQSGDKEALGLLFDRYSRVVLSVGLRILRDRSEAQELVQDVFIYVYRKCESFDATKSPFRSWLIQIAYCRSFDRRNYLIARRFYDYHNIDEIAESVRSDVSLENIAELSELRRIFKQAFRELTECQKRTLELVFFEGYSLREISIYLVESIGNTRNHYYRGLEKLKSAVKSYAPDLTTAYTNGKS